MTIITKKSKSWEKKQIQNTNQWKINDLKKANLQPINTMPVIEKKRETKNIINGIS